MDTGQRQISMTAGVAVSYFGIRRGEMPGSLHASESFGRIRRLILACFKPGKNHTAEPCWCFSKNTWALSGHWVYTAYILEFGIPFTLRCGVFVDLYRLFSVICGLRRPRFSFHDDGRLCFPMCISYLGVLRHGFLRVPSG